MKKPYKLFILALALLPAAVRAQVPLPSLGSWSQADRNGAGAFELPSFSFERLAPASFAGSVAFRASVSGLAEGGAYVVCVPYASSLSVSSRGGASASADGASLISVARGPDLELTVKVQAPDRDGAFALRGASVRPLGASAAASVLAWFLIVLLGAFCAFRSFRGLRAFIADRSRHPELIGAVFAVAVLASAFAAFRLAASPLLPVFSAGLETALRAASFSLLLGAGLWVLLSSLAFRRAGLLAWAAAGAAVLAFAASFPAGLPSTLGTFALGCFAALCAVACAAASLLAKRPFPLILTLSLLFASLLAALSALAVSPILETVLSLAAGLPLLLLSCRDCLRLRSEAGDVLLSDYADQVSEALTRFVPKEFLSILDKTDASELKLGDHVKKDMTIFFSDIRSFTTLSEGLTPEENFKFINSYLARVVPVVTAHGGFVDKYIGDAIMALFPDGAGADAAVRAAIEMQHRVVEYNQHRANCGYRPLSMGIGLHTGTLMLGVVGVQDRMQSTVISDAVNLASRLDTITKAFNISMAISGDTFKSLEDPGAYMVRFIGRVRVKGKVDPVQVFEIFDGLDERLKDLKMKANRFFEQGMLSHSQKDYREAMFYFRKVLDILPDDAAATFYLDNCIGRVQA